MMVGVTEIRTPFDWPMAYNWSWRHEVAKLTPDQRKELGALVPDDEYIRQQRRYLDNAGTPEFEKQVFMMMRTQRRDSMPKSVVMANRIYGSTGISQIKDRLECLLLCPGVSYESIGRAFNMTADQVDAYERLFYNVRDGERKLITACGLVEYFARRGASRDTSPNDEAGHSRALAFEMGAPALLTSWGWNDKELADQYDYVEMQTRLMPMMYRELERRLRYGLMGNRDLAESFSNGVKAFADMQRDGILSNSGRVPLDHLLVQIVGMAGRPGRIAPDEAQMARMQTALDDKKKLLAEAGRGKTALPAATLDYISEQIKERQK